MSALLLFAHYITRIHFLYFKEPRFTDVLAEINDLEESLQEPLKADVENSVVDFLIGGQVYQWIERPSNDDAIKHLESFCRTAQTAECMFKQFPFSWFSESMITLRGLRGLLDDSCFMFLKLHVEDLEWLVPGISGRRVVDDQPCLKKTPSSARRPASFESSSNSGGPNGSRYEKCSVGTTCLTLLDSIL